MFKKKSCFFCCVFYGIVAIICLIGIKTLYVFFFIFAALSGLYGYLAYKHRKDQPHPLLQKFINKRNEKRQAKGKPVDGDFISRKQLKSEYKTRLAEIESEFAFDYDAEYDSETDNLTEDE